MDEWMNGWMIHGWMDWWMHGWMKAPTANCICMIELCTQMQTSTATMSLLACHLLDWSKRDTRGIPGHLQDRCTRSLIILSCIPRCVESPEFTLPHFQSLKCEISWSLQMAPRIMVLYSSKGTCDLSYMISEITLMQESGSLGTILGKWQLWDLIYSATKARIGIATTCGAGQGQLGSQLVSRNEFLGGCKQQRFIQDCRDVW